MALTKPKKQQKPAKKVPERRCIGCMETREKRDLIRVVRSPEGEISIAPEIYDELEKEIRAYEAEAANE